MRTPIVAKPRVPTPTTYVWDIRLPVGVLAEQHQWVVKQAKTLGVSMSEVIRRLIDEARAKDAAKRQG